MSSEHFTLAIYCIPSRSLTAKAPEKLPFHPIGKDRLPTIIFQGRAVKLREGIGDDIP